MEDVFKHFNEQQDFLSKEKNYLLAISGGVDSIVLFDLFKRSGYSFEVAHCNFKLREEESDLDESFVQKLCERNGIPFYVKHFQTQEFADGGGISIQMAARELRYSWFNHLKNELGIDYIVTAHHLNDRIETTLFNLIKGTGLKGLASIQPRNLDTLRPLLGFTKAQIEEYAESKNLSWREDSSNSSIKYRRNKIRKEVVPHLRDVNPALEKTFQNTYLRLDEALALMNQYIQEFADKYVARTKYGIEISTKGLLDSPAPTTVLHEILDPFGYKFSQVNEIISGLGKSQSGKVYLSVEYSALIDRGKLIITSILDRNGFEKRVEDYQDVEIPTGKILIKEGTDLTIIKDPFVALLDARQVKFPLHIRYFREGDSFVPLGMQSKKKLSDFFIDQKIPVSEKYRIPLILSGPEIIWVAGYRINHRFRVTGETQKVCIITYEPS